MTDQRTILQKQFEPANRWPLFGDLLVRMRVIGFRCHSDTLVNLSSPITAFCGLNGTGKSTLLQIAAAAYGSPKPRIRPYYIRNFLVTGRLDPRPFTENATIQFYYWKEDRTERQLTITRNERTKRWQGYRARPPGYVFFAGVGVYLPRFEQRDYVFRDYHKLEFDHSESVQVKLRESISSILSVHYDDIIVNTAGNDVFCPRIVTVDRAGTSYSEAHMGCGEGRIQYIVTELEALKDKSLVLIEEPEKSLHPSAQYNFGRYLVMFVLESIIKFC
jgi:predicted ATP-dependent endonuclease of OLD family